MMMRYHWGQGIGHTYCCNSNISTSNSFPNVEPPEPEDNGPDNKVETEVCGNHQCSNIGNEAEMEILDGLEYGMDERENEHLAGSDKGSQNWNSDHESDLDDETYLQMEEMYNSQVL